MRLLGFDGARPSSDPPISRSELAEGWNELGTLAREVETRRAAVERMQAQAEAFGGRRET